MIRYRIAVDASVCFDIDAESEEEALEKAQVAVVEARWWDGQGVDALREFGDAIAYLGDPKTIEVQDEYEL